MDAKSETFIMHVLALEVPLSELSIQPDRKAQIASLLTEKVTIPNEYSDFAIVFLEKKALVLSKQTELSKHVIELEGNKQPSYGQIYSLDLVELETLKAYIKTHLKTRFIWPSKSPAGALILFDKMPDSSFYLCVNYRGLCNLTIKNQYLLPLIRKSLDRLGQAKKFTQLDPTSAHY